MAEYGDFKKEIRTLGDLRTFVNETLKDIEDNYTFDIDDNFMGLDIILLSNCDVSYSEQSFYWSAKVNNVTDIPKVIEDRGKAKCKIKALEIIKEHIKFEDSGIETYTDYLKNLVTKFMIRLESKDTGATFHIHLDTKEEFDLLRECLE